jgi:MFS family permease
MISTRHYGWVIFSLSVTNLPVEGGVKNTVPVVYVALRDSFHWSAAATAGIFSLGGLTGALCAPLLGRLLDRIGPRYLFPLGGLLILLGYLTSSCVTELWHLYILYSVLATVGENSISSVTTAATLSPWFPRNRGRMLGLADAGNSLGQVVFLPVAQLLIATIGWRDTFRLFGLLFFLLVGPADFLLQRRPPVLQGIVKGGWSRETGTPSSRRAPPDAPRMRRILRHPSVWCLVMARLLATMGNHLTQVHMVAFFIAAGYNPLLAASAMGAMGLVGMVGRPLSGTLSDVLGREVVYTVGSGMQMGGIVALRMPTSSKCRIKSAGSSYTRYTPARSSTSSLYPPESKPHPQSSRPACGEKVSRPSEQRCPERLWRCARARAFSVSAMARSPTAWVVHWKPCRWAYPRRSLRPSWCR